MHEPICSTFTRRMDNKGRSGSADVSAMKPGLVLGAH